jgi:hypothetical protein
MAEDEEPTEETVDLKSKEDELRRAKLNDMIRKLDAGLRPNITGHFWSAGDSLASETSDVSRQYLFYLAGYMLAHGVTDRGQTGDTNEKTYKQVAELRHDLSMILKIEQKWKTTNRVELELEILPKLGLLIDKYEPKLPKLKTARTLNKIAIIEDHLLLQIEDILPTIIAQTSSVISTEGGRGMMGFNPEQIPRFNRPDLMAARRER